MSKKDFKSIPTCWKSCWEVRLFAAISQHSVLVPLFLVFSGFSSIARTTTKPRIERSVTLFSVVPIASHVTQKGQQQQQLVAETHKRRKKKSLPSSLEETARRDEGSLVVKDEVARYASGPVKEIIKWKVSKPAEYVAEKKVLDQVEKVLLF